MYSPRIDAVLASVEPEDRVLDVGCVQHDADNEARDRWLHGHLREHAAEVVGIDYLKEDVQALENRGYDVRVADAEAFDLEESFDVVVAGELIEHLVNPGAFLECASEHLTEDGTLVLTTPNPWAFHRFRQALSDDVFVNPEHTCWFDRKTLTQLLKRCDYRIDTVEYLHPPLKSWVSLENPNVVSFTTICYELGLRAIGASTFLVAATPI